jgi:hypothetical protein
MNTEEKDLNVPHFSLHEEVYIGRTLAFAGSKSFMFRIKGDKFFADMNVSGNRTRSLIDHLAEERDARLLLKCVAALS